MGHIIKLTMMKIVALLMCTAAHAIDVDFDFDVDHVVNTAFLETQATMQVSTEMLTSLMSESFAYTTDHSVSSKLQCPMGKVGCPLLRHHRQVELQGKNSPGLR